MEHQNNIDPNNQEQDVEEILELEINEDDYQYTEKGFDPKKK